MAFNLLILPLDEVGRLYPARLEMAPTMRVDGGAGTSQQRCYDGMTEMLHPSPVKMHPLPAKMHPSMAAL